MSNIFDLTLLPSNQIGLLKSMDQTTQFETIKRFLDIYRLSGAKKIEKFLFILLFNDLQNDIYLKFEIVCALKDHVTSKNVLKIYRVFDTLIFLILQTAFVIEEHWLILSQLLIKFRELCASERLGIGSSQSDQPRSIPSDVEKTLMKNIVILGFKKLKHPFEKLSTLINKLYPTSLPVAERPNELWLYIYTTYKAFLTIQNKLLLLQIIFEGENEFLSDLLGIATDSSSASRSCSLSNRLEACDILFLKGSATVKTRAQQFIETLVPEDAYTTNSENVHMSSISASVTKTLSVLLEKNQNNDRRTSHNLYDRLTNKFSSNLNIQGSLYRIFNYNFLKFTDHGLTLKDVIEEICLFIDSFPTETQQQLYTRLGQELDDMYNTCSQGYLARLINVFSGFGVEDVGISIGVEDQIYAVFSLKVNAHIAAASPELKDVLLEELTVPTNEPERRINLMRYLRPYWSTIWNEIFNEFSQLTTTDLDLYCRKVLLKYEGNF